MDFRNMSDSELATVMVNYIGRVENLMNIIGMYLDGNRNFTPEMIRADYSELKNELKEDAHYLELERNQGGSQLYMGAFMPSIREAAAWGFTVPVNRGVDQRMYTAVSDALYKLEKYKSLEEWGEWM